MHSGNGVAAQDRCPAAATSRNLARLCLLLAGGDQSFRGTTSAILRGMGARTVSAGGAAAALAAVGFFRFSAAVMDIGTGPGKFAFIRRLRSLPAERGGATPAVAVIGSADPAEPDRCLEAGFQAVLVKPIDRAALLEALAALVSHRGEPVQQ